MQSQGLMKGWVLLAEAEQDLHKLKTLLTFEVMHRHWQQFLISANGITNVVDKVASLTPRVSGGVVSGNVAGLIPCLNYMLRLVTQQSTASPT
jgi:hypothetical protein